MNNSVNDGDSIITCAPEFQSKEPFLNLPKPFGKFAHLRDPLLCKVSSDSPRSPALVSPHNRAWLDSPDSFIGRIPESSVLAECVAFVDVWSTEGNDNRSIVFARILSRMGATIAKKFTKLEKITHLIFKDGHKLYLQKAKKRGIKVVNCLWVDKCRLTQTWVDEEPYFFDDSNYIPPKKFREMQPLNPEQEEIRSAERAKRRQKKEDMKNARKAVGFLSPLVTNEGKNKNDIGRKTAAILACETPHHPFSHSFYHPRLVSETPSESIRRKLQRMKEGKPIFSPPSSPLSDSSQISEIGSTVRSAVAQATSGVPSHGKDSVIASSHRSSNMDITCTGHGRICPSEIQAIVLDDLEALDTINRKNNLTNSENSEINLHVSGSSKSFSDDSNVFVEDSSSEITPTRNNTTSVPLPLPKELPKRARRRLCEEEILAPASILVSPKPSQPASAQALPVSRRSRRQSSITASQAISLLYKPKRSSHCSDDSVLTQDSSVSTLPLPGVSGLKFSSTRRRYFEPIRISTSAVEDDCISCDDNPTSRSYCSLSTAFEDNANNEKHEDNIDKQYDFHEVNHRALKLSFNCDPKPSSPSLKSRSISKISLAVRSWKFSSPGIRQRYSEVDAITGTLFKDFPKDTSPDKENMVPSKTLRRKKTGLAAAKNKEAFNKQNILQDITDAPKPRRSTDEFQTVPLCETPATQKRRKRKPKKTLKPVLVFTSLHSNERVDMEKIVRHLGRFCIRSSVKDELASHVICGAARRTLNVLHAITKGLWLLSKDWLVDSMRAGKWLREEEYEVDYFPSAMQTRMLRDQNPLWSYNLFHSVKGYVYVSPDTVPPQRELCELVSRGGGHLIGNPRRAEIRVGRWVTHRYSLPAVKETWILGIESGVELCDDELDELNCTQKIGISPNTSKK